jgi:ADP-ribosylglycohydrolase
VVIDDEHVPDRASAKDRFLGCVLGQAIGDALGMPVECWEPERIRASHGWIDRYLPRRDDQGGILVPAGEFTGDTEMAVCHIESLISSGGLIDPEGVGVRLVRMYNGESRRFLGRTTLAALAAADQSGDFQAGISGDWPPGNGAATRVAPIGLLHALGRFNAEVYTREVLRAGLITHSHPESLNGALAFAFAVRLLVAREAPPEVLLDEVLAFIDEDPVAERVRQARRLLGPPRGFEQDLANLQRIGTSSYVAETVAAALYCFARHPDDFRQAVLTAVNAGGDADTIAGMTGALSGAYLGAAALPTELVDGLEGRMYLLVAGPGLYRAAQRRAGLFLRLREGE